MSATFYLMHYLKEFTIFPQGEGKKKKTLTVQDFTLFIPVNYLRSCAKPSPLNLYNSTQKQRLFREGWEALCKLRFSDPKRAPHSFGLVSLDTRAEWCLVAGDEGDLAANVEPSFEDVNKY